VSKIAVVIVEYEAKKQVSRLVRQLRKMGPPPSAIGRDYGEVKEIIVIDNNKNNVGFAAGVNKGIKKALKNGAEKILIINPDIRLGGLERLERLGDVEGAVLKFRRGSETVYDFGGKVNWWLGRCTHLEISQGLPLLSKERPFKADYVSGAFMVVDRKVFEKIGLFDERFFLYFEDVDFCLRAKEAGFKVTVNPKIIIEHQIEEHRFSYDDFKFNLALKSNRKFIFKWINPIFWPVATGYLGCLRILRNLRKMRNDFR
jgi:GT2 family glycosyltransferase